MYWDIRVASQKFIEKQPQILRLTTPNLHPNEQRSLVGDPGKLKNVWGPVCSG